MGSPRDDFDLLLAAPHPVEAELARGMLADAGIPVLVHGGDFDVAELGSATHAMLRRPDVYVPKGSKIRALEVLNEGGYYSSIDAKRDDDVVRFTRERRAMLVFFILWVVVFPLVGYILLTLT